MRPLDEETIRRLELYRAGVNQPCPLYVVDYENSIVVCDNTLLLEWPLDLVDTDCNRYRKLVKGCNHQYAKYQEFYENHWINALIGKGDIVMAEEVDPKPEEIAYFTQFKANKNGNTVYDEHGEPIPVGGTVVFQADRRCYYHAYYFDIIFHYVEDRQFGIYIPHPDDPVADFIRYLCVFEGADLVGVVCNQLYRDEGTEVLMEDPETGKVLVGERV